MAFYKDVSEKLKTELDTLFSSFSVSVYGGTGACIEGHKGLLYMASDEVVFKTKKGTLTLKGRNLQITEIGQTDAYITGKVVGVSIGDINE